MESTCAGCKQLISTTRFLQCYDCKASYHPICVNVGAIDIPNATNWTCPTCRAKEPKYGNLNTPIRTSNLPDVSNANAPSRAQKRMALSSPSRPDHEDDFETDSVASELRLLRLEMGEIKTCLQLLTKGVNECNSRLDSFENRIKSIEEWDPVISTLRDTVYDLQDQINQQAQAALKNELEISGISETTNENLQHIAMVVATKVGINLPESEIDWAVRAGPKTRNSNNKEATFPRPIIVRLIRKSKRDEFINAAKLRKNVLITSADLELMGPPRNIYINEHLSKYNRMLFRDARLRARERGYRFTWIRNGRILIRKDEKMPAIVIKSPADLDRLPCRSSNQAPSGLSS